MSYQDWIKNGTLKQYEKMIKKIIREGMEIRNRCKVCKTIEEFDKVLGRLDRIQRMIKKKALYEINHDFMPKYLNYFHKKSEDIFNEMRSSESHLFLENFFKSYLSLTKMNYRGLRAEISNIRYRLIEQKKEEEGKLEMGVKMYGKCMGNDKRKRT